MTKDILKAQKEKNPTNKQEAKHSIFSFFFGPIQDISGQLHHALVKGGKNGAFAKPQGNAFLTRKPTPSENTVASVPSKVTEDRNRQK